MKRYTSYLKRCSHEEITLAFIKRPCIGILSNAMPMLVCFEGYDQENYANTIIPKIYILSWTLRVLSS